MSTTKLLPQQKTVALALILIIAVSVYRVVSGAYLTSLPNFSPVMAVAFCCGFALPGVSAFIVPLVVLLVSDFILNSHFGVPMFNPALIAMYACYICAIGLGRVLHRAGFVLVAAATVFDSVLFYAVTNSAAWAQDPNYTHNVAGWVQALTVGLPGYPPTWVFFRNSLVSDLLFTAAFFLMFSLVSKPAAQATDAQRQVS